MFPNFSNLQISVRPGKQPQSDDKKKKPQSDDNKKASSISKHKDTPRLFSPAQVEEMLQSCEEPSGDHLLQMLQACQEASSSHSHSERQTSQTTLYTADRTQEHIQQMKILQMSKYVKELNKMSKAQDAYNLSNKEIKRRLQIDVDELNQGEIVVSNEVLQNVWHELQEEAFNLHFEELKQKLAKAGKFDVSDKEVEAFLQASDVEEPNTVPVTSESNVIEKLHNEVQKAIEKQRKETTKMKNALSAIEGTGKGKGKRKQDPEDQKKKLVSTHTARIDCPSRCRNTC